MLALAIAAPPVRALLRFGQPPLAELCLTLMAVALAVAAGALLSRALAQRGTRNAA